MKASQKKHYPPGTIVMLSRGTGNPVRIIRYLPGNRAYVMDDLLHKSFEVYLRWIQVPRTVPK